MIGTTVTDLHRFAELGGAVEVDLPESVADRFGARVVRLACSLPRQAHLISLTMLGVKMGKLDRYDASVGEPRPVVVCPFSSSRLPLLDNDLPERLRAVEGREGGRRRSSLRALESVTLLKTTVRSPPANLSWAAWIHPHTYSSPQKQCPNA